MKESVVRGIICGTLLYISTRSYADDELSLADILNLEVTVSSKKSESIVDAPGNVTAYSQQDIDRTGYYTIKDLANITAGYSAEKNTLGEIFLSTRGQRSLYNHLIMVDEIPINFARNYGVRAGEELPLLFAERAEFLRGPASALYGTSAFFGVINLISKDYEEKQSEYRSLLDAGNKDDNRRYLTSYGNDYGAGEFSFNFGYFTKKPYKEPLKDNIASDETYYRNDSETMSFYGKHTSKEGLFKGVTTGMILLSERRGYGYGWNGTDALKNISWDQYHSYIPFIKYKRSLTDNLRLNSYIKYHEALDRGSVANLGWRPNDQAIYWFGYDVKIVNMEYQSELQYDIGEDSSMIFGFNIDRRRHSPDESYLQNSVDDTFPRFSSSTSKTDSAYVQGQSKFDVLSGLILTAGARYDKGTTKVAGEDKTYSQVSPRIALVQKLSDSFSIKVLAGSALKAPSTADYNYNNEKSEFINPGFMPSIEAETIQTTELSFAWIGSSMSATLSLFQDETKDKIQGVALSDEAYVNEEGEGDRPSIITNADGSIKGTGGELDLNYVLGSHTKLSVNYAYGQAKNNDGSWAEGAPRSRVNLIASYVGTSITPTTGTVVFKYIDAVGSIDGHTNPGYQTVDMKLGQNVTKDTKFEIAGENITNRRYHQYDDVPGHDESYTFRVKTVF